MPLEKLGLITFRNAYPQKREKENILKETEGKKHRRKRFFFRKQAIAKVLNIAQVKEDENQDSQLILAVSEDSPEQKPGYQGLRTGQLVRKRGLRSEVLKLSTAQLSAQKGRGERREGFQKGSKGQKKKVSVN